VVADDRAVVIPGGTASDVVVGVVVVVEVEVLPVADDPEEDEPAEDEPAEEPDPDAPAEVATQEGEAVASQTKFAARQVAAVV
jgi:hypothetical protein